jgi:hypothetical protein
MGVDRTLGVSQRPRRILPAVITVDLALGLSKPPQQNQRWLRRALKQIRIHADQAIAFGFQAVTMMGVECEDAARPRASRAAAVRHLT